MILQLFIQFLLIGMVAFGGGTAMIPLLQRVIVTDQSWLSLNEFIDVIGISQMTPGPIAINAATFIGFNSVYLEYGFFWLGLVGALAATTGVLVIPVVFMTLIIRYEQNPNIKEAINRILSGVKPALVGLILASAMTVALASEINVLKAIWISSLIIVFYRSKIHPIFWILASGILGVIIL